jgi:hypothetical protein
LSGLRRGELVKKIAKNSAITKREWSFSSEIPVLELI